MPQDRSTKKKNEGHHSEENKRRWRGKRMHGQLPCNLDVKMVDIEQSYRWLKSGDIKGETESTIVAAQDQAISKIYFNPLNAELNPICHLLALLGAHHILHVSGLKV